MNFEIDSCLAGIESGLNGFTSLRSFFATETESIRNLQDYLATKYIHDDFLNSILNTYGEVKVDSNYYVFFGDGGIYEIPIASDSALTILRGKGKLTTAYFPDVMSFSGVKIYKQSAFEFKRIQKKAYSDVEPFMAANKVDCEPYKVQAWGGLTGYGDAWDNDMADYIVDWSVNWGDNSQVEVSYDPNLNLYHSYANAGSYVVSITCRYKNYYNINQTFTESQDLSVSAGATCASYDNHVSDWLQTESQNPDYAMSAILEFNGYMTFFDLNSRFLAETRCWKWDSNHAEWDLDRNESYVKLVYVFRDFDCYMDESGSDEKEYKKRKTRTAIERQWFAHANSYNGENKSLHKVIFPGYDEMTINLELTPCK